MIYTIIVKLLIVIIVSFIISYLIGGICYLLFIIKFNRKDKNFKDKHVLIFGGSSGLGKALAIRLAKQGARISIASRAESKLKETQSQCKAENPLCICDYYICDIEKVSDVTNVLNLSINKLSFPSLIINSAGIAHPGFIEDMTYTQYERDMNLNYFGNLRVLKETKQLYNKLKITQRVDIVCVGSVYGIIGGIGYSAYNPTKYAVKGLVDVLRFEFINSSIHLHYFAPSNMKTPGLEIENKTKPDIVLKMEENVQTITADYAAHALLCNLDDYVITTEADLELLKNATAFMGENTFIDLLCAPLASLGVMLSRWGIEKSIKKSVINNNSNINKKNN